MTGHYSGTPPQQAELDGVAYKLGAGDVLFAGVGSTHAFYNPRRAVTDQS